MKKLFCIISVVCILAVSVMGSVFASAFVDVPKDAYYAEAAERMNREGILTGYGDGLYNGDDNITRAQMAVVAVRLLGKEAEAKKLAGKTVFSDFTPAHNWATGYVNLAVAEKIIIGDGDGNFRPDDPVKYEEVVKTIVCVLGLDEGVEIVPGDWSKEYIEAAKEANLLNGLIGKKGEPMKRSDIAVICSSSFDIIEEKNIVDETTEAEATTKKPSSLKPQVEQTTAESEETTEIITRPMGPLETPPAPDDE